MKIQRTNNQYKQNFGAISAKPTKKFTDLKFEIIKAGFKYGLKTDVDVLMGINKNGNEVVVFKTAYKSSEEKKFYNIAKRIMKDTKIFKNVNLMKDETAKTYTSAYSIENSDFPSILDFERISY